MPPQILVDGHRASGLEGDSQTLIEVLQQVVHQLQGTRRGIQKLKVNGEAITLEQLDKTLASRPMGEVHSVDIQTESLENLAGQTIENLRQLLPELPVLCQHLAEVFAGPTPEEGYGLFDQLTLIWAEVKAHQQHAAKALGVGLDGLILGGRSVAAHHAELAQRLEAAQLARDNGDSVGLADLLEYELAPRAEQEMALTELIERERSS